MVAKSCHTKESSLKKVGLVPKNIRERIFNTPIRAFLPDHPTFSAK